MWKYQITIRYIDFALTGLAIRGVIFNTTIISPLRGFTKVRSTVILVEIKFSVKHQAL